MNCLEDMRLHSRLSMCTLLMGALQIYIYTAFRSYFNDYSYIGLFLIQFVLGLVFGYWHKCIISHRKVVPIQVLLYGYYIVKKN